MFMRSALFWDVTLRNVPEERRSQTQINWSKIILFGMLYLVLCTPWRHRGSGCIPLLISKLDAMCSVSTQIHGPAVLNHGKERPQYPLNRKADGPQIRSVGLWNKNISCHCQESTHDCSVTQPAA
jgi:hypothetical protein